MGRPARLTLAALSNYDPTLFDLMELPEPPIAADIGVQANQLRTTWTINKQDLIDYICLKTASMGLCFPDAIFMRKAIGTWSKAHVHEWQRAFDTLFYKYNPLWNKDGTYSETGRDTDATTGEAETTGKGVHYTHGYADQTIILDSLHWTHADRNDTEQNATTESNRTFNTARQHLEQGNIGVTMTQELIAKEREIAMYNIDDIICESFKREFCILIW